MYAVVRTYSGQGASELFDLPGQREEDVKPSSPGSQASPASADFPVPAMSLAICPGLY
jgi:hypothetical protein